MSSRLIAGGDGAGGAVDRAEAARLLRAGEFFWLDLDRPCEADLELLRESFGFHPLSLEDTARFGQRPKLDDYDDFAFVVIYAAAPGAGGRLVEVHLFYSERCLVTVRRDDCPALAELRQREARRARPMEPILVLHQVIDALVDSLFPLMSGFDDELDRIEEQMAREPDERQQQAIYGMRRRLVTLRKAVMPQRDLLARLAAGVAELPGMTAEAERYFRDAYDHQIRIADLLDSYRDLLSGATDVYLSTVSNRLNAVMKQLAVIATVFLPLTFVTGFFGQNFGWMVNAIGGGWAFLIVGIGSQLLVLAGLLVLFRRHGWL